MATTPSFPIDPAIFWDTVKLFAGYDYAFPPNHTPSLSAQVGYPKLLLDLGRKLGAEGFSNLPNADALAPGNYRKHSFTNCCMFVEGVLIGAALQTHGRAFAARWTSAHHQAAMNLNDNKLQLSGPPRAYVHAGLAEPVDIRALEKPLPGAVYVVQGAGHTWLIVDSVDGYCLRLEASFARKEAPEFGQPAFFGGVAHAGLGRVPVDRRQWKDRVKLRGDAYRWTTLRARLIADLESRASASYVSMARVLLRDATDPRHVVFPFEPPGAPGVTAAAAYARNEALEHGFFPLGGERGIHTGVHFSQRVGERIHDAQDDDGKDAPTAGGELQPVYCMAPGTLIAARLANAAHASPSETAVRHAARSEDLTGSANGLALVRHTLQGLDERGEPDASATFTLHTLYMHLLSPAWKSNDVGEPYAAVPWIDQLVRPGAGAVIGVDPNHSKTFARRSFTVARAQADVVRRAGTAAAAVTTYGPTFCSEDKQTFGATGKPPVVLADVVAVTRPPEPRFAEASKVLKDPGEHHKLLTLANMPLAVARGELLGFVGPRAGSKARAEGFLHWELFAAPSGEQSDLVKLLEYAVRVLGPDVGPFPLVKETSSDNVLQQAELRALLAALPDQVNPPLGRDRLLNSGGEPSYNNVELARTLHDPVCLPFTRTPPAQVPAQVLAASCKATAHAACDGHNLWYEGAIEIGVHALKVQDGAAERSVPTWEGELELELEFDVEAAGVQRRWKATVKDGVARLKVPMPALARFVHVTAVTPGVHLEMGAPATDERGEQAEAKARVAQFKSLTQARWRGVVVEHCNEWSQAGLKKTLEARHSSYAPDSVDAVAWWDHDEAPLDDQGSLFGGGAHQLPKAADKLHNANPTTIAWLIELLIRARRLQFVAPADPTLAGGPPPPLFAGWVPVEATPRVFPVGFDRVHAVAVAPREGFNDDLQFVAVIAGRQYPFAQSSYYEGVIAARPTRPLWGRARLLLRRDGAAVAATNVLGSGEVEFAVPLLAGAAPDGGDRQDVALAPPSAPSRSRKKWCFEVPWASNRPDSLRGWVVLQARQDDGAFVAVESIGVPVAAVKPKPKPKPKLKVKPKVELSEDVPVEISEVEFDPTAALGELLSRTTGPGDAIEVRYGVLFVLGREPNAPHLTLDAGFELSPLLAQPHRCGWASEASVVLQRPAIGAIEARVERVGKNLRLMVSAPLIGGDTMYWRGAAPSIVIDGIAEKLIKGRGVSSGAVHASVPLKDRDPLVGTRVTLSVKVGRAAACKGLKIEPAGVRLPAALVFEVKP